MAYETGTASSPGDLLVKLFDFCAANGWTINDDISSAAQSPGYGNIYKASSPESEYQQWVGFAWDANNLRLWGYRGYTSGPPTIQADSHSLAADDNYTSFGILYGPVVNFPIGGPFDAYHFFGGPRYVHVVVEWSAGLYRHFGFGQLVKAGRWQGGEYIYGHFVNQGTTDIDIPSSNDHDMGIDGYYNTNTSHARFTMWGKQIDGTPFPELVGRNSPDSQWHQEGQDAGSGAGPSGGLSDVNGSDKGALIVWGPRGNGWAPVSGMGFSHFDGYRPLFPHHVFTHYTGSNPDIWRLLGTIPDQRYIGLDQLDPVTEFNIGADTWITFPVIRKLNPSGLDIEGSYNWGRAYKKVT